MKKLLLGLIIGLLMSLPAGAFAWSQKQMARPIVGADCAGPYKVDEDGYYIYENGEKASDPNGNNGRCSVTIYKFTDAGNTCYVSKGPNNGGIFCMEADR